jgi:hypothetical protein
MRAEVTDPKRFKVTQDIVIILYKNGVGGAIDIDAERKMLLELQQRTFTEIAVKASQRSIYGDSRNISVTN